MIVGQDQGIGVSVCRALLRSVRNCDGANQDALGNRKEGKMLRCGVAIVGDVHIDRDSHWRGVPVLARPSGGWLASRQSSRNALMAVVGAATL